MIVFVCLSCLFFLTKSDIPMDNADDKNKINISLKNQSDRLIHMTRCQVTFDFQYTCIQYIVIQALW